MSQQHRDPPNDTINKKSYTDPEQHYDPDGVPNSIPFYNADGEFVPFTLPAGNTYNVFGANVDGFKQMGDADEIGHDLRVSAGKGIAWADGASLRYDPSTGEIRSTIAPIRGNLAANTVGPLIASVDIGRNASTNQLEYSNLSGFTRDSVATTRLTYEFTDLLGVNETGLVFVIRANGSITDRQALSYAFPVGTTAIYFMAVSNAYDDAGMGFYMQSHKIHAFWASSGGSMRGLADPWMDGLTFPAGVSFSVHMQIQSGHSQNTGQLPVDTDDSTITGDGTTGDPLKVANPLNAANFVTTADSLSLSQTAEVQRHLGILGRVTSDLVTISGTGAQSSPLTVITPVNAQNIVNAIDEMTSDQRSDAGADLGVPTANKIREYALAMIDTARAEGNVVAGNISYTEDAWAYTLTIQANAITESMLQRNSVTDSKVARNTLKARSVDGSDAAAWRNKIGAQHLSDNELWADVSGDEPTLSGNAGAVPYVHAWSNARFTASNIGGMVYHQSETAVASGSGVWVSIIVPITDEYIDVIGKRRHALSTLRLISGSRVYAATDWEYVIGAGLHVAYFQVQIDATQGDKIRVQEFALADRLPPSTRSLTSSDNGKLIFANNSEYALGILADTHGFKYEFNTATGNLDTQLLLAGNTWPAIGTQFEVGDPFINWKLGLGVVKPGSGKTNSISVTFTAGSHGGTVGWDRRTAAVDKFGPDPVPIAGVPRFTTDASDGTWIYTSLDLGDFCIADAGNTGYRLKRGQTIDGLHQYFNTTTGQVMTAGAGKTLTLHAQSGHEPFDSTVGHWALQHPFIEGPATTPVTKTPRRVSALDSSDVTSYERVILTAKDGSNEVGPYRGRTDATAWDPADGIAPTADVIRNFKLFGEQDSPHDASLKSVAFALGSTGLAATNPFDEVTKITFHTSGDDSNRYTLEMSSSVARGYKVPKTLRVNTTDYNLSPESSSDAAVSKFMTAVVPTADRVAVGLSPTQNMDVRFADGTWANGSSDPRPAVVTGEMLMRAFGGPVLVDSLPASPQVGMRITPLRDLSVRGVGVLTAEFSADAVSSGWYGTTGSISPSIGHSIDGILSYTGASTTASFQDRTVIWSIASTQGSLIPVSLFVDGVEYPVTAISGPSFPGDYNTVSGNGHLLAGGTKHGVTVKFQDGSFAYDDVTLESGVEHIWDGIRWNRTRYTDADIESLLAGYLDRNDYIKGVVETTAAYTARGTATLTDGLIHFTY